MKVAFAIIALLVGSMLLGSVDAQTPMDWEKHAFDQRNTNFSPQTEITGENVKQLALKWIYRAPRDPEKEIPAASRAFAIQTTPLVVNGIVYIATPLGDLIALNSLNGVELWRFETDLASVAQNPNWGGLQIESSLAFHNGLIWMQTVDCNIYGFDPLTGERRRIVADTCNNIPGNTGAYVGHYAPSFYRNIVITRASGGLAGGRGFVAGYDINSGELLWRWYSVPPSGGDPEWDERTGARSGNIDPFPGDWGKTDLIGGGSVWGIIAVDEETGVIYFPTGTAAGGYDASLRPGPNLYTNSIIALNATSGEMLWYFQTTPQDVNYDEPGIGVILAEAGGGVSMRKVVMTGTKGDWIYFLNAKTGKPIFDPIDVGTTRINRFNQNLGNKANFTLSQRIYAGKIFCPGSEGGMQSYNAFAYNTLYIVSQSLCRQLVLAKISYKGGIMDGFTVQPAPQISENSTLYAIDTSTGRIKWRFFMPNRYQGGVTVSNGVVYLLDIAGVFYAVNAETGEPLKRIQLNSPGVAGVSLGHDTKGEMTVFVAIGGSRPGIVVALSPANISAPTTVTVMSIDIAALVTVSFAIAAISLAYAVLISRRYSRLRKQATRIS